MGRNERDWPQINSDDSVPRGSAGAADRSIVFDNGRWHAVARRTIGVASTPSSPIRCARTSRRRSPTAPRTRRGGSARRSSMPPRCSLPRQTRRTSPRSMSPPAPRRWQFGRVSAGAVVAGESICGHK